MLPPSGLIVLGIQLVHCFTNKESRHCQPAPYCASQGINKVHRYILHSPGFLRRCIVDGSAEAADQILAASNDDERLVNDLHSLVIPDGLCIALYV